MIPYIPHLNHTSPYTPILFTLLLTTLVILIPTINIIPLRITCLFLGLFPFFLTHPFTRTTLLPLLFLTLRPHLKRLRTRAMRVVDDDRLEDKHWMTEIQEVELWENERWSPAGTGTTSPTEADGTMLVDVGWSKGNLKPGERKGWTRGRDGWSAVAEDGSGDVRSVVISLSFGLQFIAFNKMVTENYAVAT